MDMLTSKIITQGKETTADYPGIVMIMPFNPKMTSSTHVEKQVKEQFKKGTELLLSSYKNQDALPVISNLNQLSKSINFHTFRKSLLVIATRFTQKLIYLDAEYPSQVILKDNFRMSDLFSLSAQQKNYLVLMVNSKCTKTYLGKDDKLQLIKTDSVIHSHPSFPFSSGLGKKENYFKLVARQFDLITEAYEMPVFMVGNKQDLEQVYEHTVQKKNIVQQIETNTDEFDEARLFVKLIPYLKDWKMMREIFLIQQLEYAKQQKLMIQGIRHISSVIKQTGCKLLLVEEQYHSPFPVDIISNEKKSGDYYTHDRVDQIIDKVLEKGGQVEMVHPGLLQDDLHIAMITSTATIKYQDPDRSKGFGSDLFL